MINNILKNPLNKFCLWCLGILLVCFIGVTNVFALETKTIYSGINNGSLSGAGYYGYGYYNQGGVESYATAQVNTTVSGQATGFVFYLYENINIQKTYTVKVNFMSTDILPSVNISNFLLSTCNNSTCNEGTMISIEKQNNNSNSQWIILKFNPTATGSIIKFDSGASANNVMTGVSNFGISSVQIESNDPQQDIINNQTNNTNNIINNNNSNTQDIINNQDQNAQDIINNQNSIAQQQQEQQQACELFNNNNIIQNGYLYSNGAIIDNDTWGITDYYQINQNTKIKVIQDIPGTYSPSLCFYDANKTVISCINYNTLSLNEYLEIPNNSYYVRFSIQIQQNRPQFEICKNGNQALQDTLTNDNIDENNISNAFETFNNFLDDNSTITQLITLPIILYTAILNNLNGTCQPFNLGKLYGSDLILPCINISQYLGNALWSMIDIIISGFAIYAISKKMIKVFNNFSSLREGDVIDD